MRAHRLVPWLRAQRTAKAIAEGIAKASKSGFRVLEFSIQGNHLHLVVEASDRRSLSRGMQGLAIRLARQINRRVGRRGSVWGERYHQHTLRTPREVRHAFVYVLMNHKKHSAASSVIDPLSSAAWFDGWCPEGTAALRSVQASLIDVRPTVAPRTWLARTGWRRHGLLRLTNAPR